MIRALPTRYGSTCKRAGGCGGEVGHEGTREVGGLTDGRLGCIWTYQSRMSRKEERNDMLYVLVRSMRTWP